MLSGANVHISFVGQDNGSETDTELDGRPVTAINSNLTAGIDVTRARRLRENIGIAFIADVKGGPFDIDETTALHLLNATNPDGRPNSDVVRPWVNGQDIAGRRRGMWIIDFGVDTPITEAALYEAPFQYLLHSVEPIRRGSRTTQRDWWIHERPGHSMRIALRGLARYFVTPRVAKHRLFAWLGEDTLADCATVAFARNDDYTFGLLHSRVHELWARATGTQLREAESGFRYTPTTCFETFPFPRPTAEQRDAIAVSLSDSIGCGRVG